MSDENSISGILSRLADACACEPDQGFYNCGPCKDAEAIDSLSRELAEARELLELVTNAFEALGYRGVPGCIKDARAFLAALPVQEPKT